jgi:hypothetical protein
MTIITDLFPIFNIVNHLRNGTEGIKNISAQKIQAYGGKVNEMVYL